MQKSLLNRALVGLMATCMVVLSWAIAPPAQAYNNPDLLPDHPTNVIDLADSLTSVQQEALDQHLKEFEQKTGWKLRVLTQFDRTPGRAVKDFWGLDDKSLLLIADPRGGNLLNFSVGDAFFPLMPRTFWIELQARYGNQFFVRDNGEDQAILEALKSVEACLQQDGCAVVPGLPREQWLLTLATSIIGGIICGFAAHPRRPDQRFAWQWVLIFSPLWGILFISFGIGPVVTRTSEWLPLFRNIAGFLLGALVAYLSPTFSTVSPSESET
ncbi:MAG TPA: TPM domain-containing protein [Synechococcales cyanobacterium M55_K2018_004]|nr:TPM domain-containing protein [Synechococcales cyanobacterium M55_K2018_004]